MYTMTPKALSLDADELKRPGCGLAIWQRQKLMCQPGLACHCDHYRRFTLADSLSTIEAFLKDCQHKRQRAWVGWGQNSGPSKWGPWLPSPLQSETYGKWDQTPGTDNEPRFYLNLNLANVQEWIEEQLEAFDKLLAKYVCVYAVEMLLAGQHGEGYYPWDLKERAVLPGEAAQRWMIDAFEQRFAGRYRLLVPFREDTRTYYALGKRWGWTMMSLGNADQFKKLDRGMDDASFGSVVRDAWKYSPCRGETYGSFGTTNPFSTIEQQIPAYHFATLGDGNFIGTYEVGPWNHWQQCQPNATTKWTDKEITRWVRAGKLSGWRHALSKIELGDLRAGETTTIATTVTNSGSTPGYDPWVLHWQLEDAHGLAADVPSTIDFRQCLPGATKTVETIQLPETPGTYRLIASVPPYGPNALSHVMPLAHAEGLLTAGRYLLGEITIVPRNDAITRLTERVSYQEQLIRELQQQNVELAQQLNEIRQAAAQALEEARKPIIIPEQVVRRGEDRTRPIRRKQRKG